MAASASATVIPYLDIDFRQGAWHAADNSSSPFTLGNVTVSAQPSGKRFWHDSVDGFGIRGGGEIDEINSSERFLVSFLLPEKLAGLWLTDLFGTPDGEDGEQGTVTLTLEDSSQVVYAFDGNDADQGNGELFVDFGKDLMVLEALFEASGTTQGDDYSVAGFDIPEPSAIGLLGLGLLGAGLARRRRRA
ncbi:PEP-CTERM sorting domain-containing protein [Oceanibacterium hippocampi]|uniref:PEP-CTERM motif protein n=1 Tax=Oceanibacterium hippocampi TaxID=745714 RepID=A0A1Y5TSC6_9PROT|nr:PEP-CTERM sorting domain-containing protein [Oceanibacterium hippocampi]SLN69038.1 PEP-CTERM motif protein [Oceanibacterium hippocampi]